MQRRVGDRVAGLVEPQQYSSEAPGKSAQGVSSEPRESRCRESTAISLHVRVVDILGERDKNDW